MGTIKPMKPSKPYIYTMHNSKSYYIYCAFFLTLIFAQPNPLLSQEYHHYPSKNDQGLYGILRRNLQTNVTDTVVPFENLQTNVLEDQFLVVTRTFPEIKNGKQHGSFYEADVYSQEMELIRHFDTIQSIHLTWANLTEFEFHENGKKAYYSVVFGDKKWTGLYDEITRTDVMKVPGHNGRKPAYIGRNKDVYTLISPFGDSLTSLNREDVVSIYWQDCFKVYREASKSWDLLDLYGHQLASNVVEQKTNFDGKTTILTHENGFQSLWYGADQQLAPVPYEFSISTMYKAAYLIGKGEDGAYYKLDTKGNIISEAYEGLYKLNGTDNLLIKEKGLWRVEGPDVEHYSDKRYAQLEILEESSNGLFYLLKMNDEVLAISAEYNWVRIGQVDDAEISLTDNRIFAKKNGKWSILTAKGFTDFSYSEFFMPSDYLDLAFAKKGRYWVAVDDNGTALFEEFNLKSIEYHSCEIGDVFELKTKDALGFYQLDSATKDVAFIYEDFECGDYGLCLKKDGKWGLINYYGEVIVDFKHKKVDQVLEYDPDE